MIGEATEGSHEMKMRMLIASLSVLMGLTVPAPRAWTQAVGGAEGARPVTGDPGMSWMLVADEPEFRVLRDYAEPGATRPLTRRDVSRVRARDGTVAFDHRI